MITASVVPCSQWTPIGCTNIDPSGASISGTMLGAAQEILYQKSGRQFDQCTLTLWPCRKDCYGSLFPWRDTWNEWGTGWPYPYLYAGQWFNAGCVGCGYGNCSCAAVNDILLPQPVASVTDVTIDGVSLSPLTNYVQLFDARQLVRIDGNEWPRCNNLGLAPGSVGTWTVTVVTGNPVPPLGQAALGELTNELVNACLHNACRLPANVQQQVRQGITQTRFDPNVVFADGKIGLYFCDLFLSTYNPKNIRERARAIDPERRTFGKQLTWP